MPCASVESMKIRASLLTVWGKELGQTPESLEQTQAAELRLGLRGSISPQTLTSHSKMATYVLPRPDFGSVSDNTDQYTLLLHTFFFLSKHSGSTRRDSKDKIKSGLVCFSLSHLKDKLQFSKSKKKKKSRSCNNP